MLSSGWMVNSMKEYTINEKHYMVKRVSLEQASSSIMDRLIHLLIELKESSLKEGESNVSNKKNNPNN